MQYVLLAVIVAAIAFHAWKLFIMPALLSVRMRSQVPAMQLAMATPISTDKVDWSRYEAPTYLRRKAELETRHMAVAQAIVVEEVPVEVITIEAPVATQQTQKPKKARRANRESVHPAFESIE